MLARVQEKRGRSFGRVGAVVAAAALVLAGALAAVGVSAAMRAWPVRCDVAHPGACTRVLFVGNSYTYVNDLPTVFARLAAAGGHPVETAMSAPGGATLADHLASADTMGLIRGSHPDVVVLQEQSVTPVTPYGRAGMEQAAAGLVAAIRSAGGTPLLFETWGHRDGWPSGGVPDYGSMQAEIDASYAAVGADLRIAVAPAGIAWLGVASHDPEVGLWADDGSHPAVAGTYLAACVLYGAVFRQSPVGLAETGGLDAGTAGVLQRAAAGAAGF